MKRREQRAHGPDADLYFGDARHQRDHRKDAQLCAQVFESISLALSEINETLSALHVVEVQVAPHAGRLQVTLQAPLNANFESLQQALEAAAGRLRYEVAQSIHRKKTPTLCFLLVPMLSEEP